MNISVSKVSYKQRQRYKEKLNIQQHTGVLASTPSPNKKVNARDLSRFQALDSWEKYVEIFCKAYSLDEKQKESAHSVLRDMLGRRENHIRSKISDVQKIIADSAIDPKERAKVKAAFSSEIDTLFQEMKNRLIKIPTTDQILRMGTTTAPSTRATTRAVH